MYVHSLQQRVSDLEDAAVWVVPLFLTQTRRLCVQSLPVLVAIPKENTQAVTYSACVWSKHACVQFSSVLVAHLEVFTHIE